MTDYYTPEGKVTTGAYRASSEDAAAAATKTDELLSALSWPQRQLKKALSGDETKWAQDMGSSKGYSHSALGMNEDVITDEAANNAIDWGIDPIDLLTAGLGKGSKVLKNVAGIGPDAGKGMFTTSASNYVNDYYGLGGDFDAPSKIEQKAMPIVTKAYEKYTGNMVPDESQLALLRKGRGMADTLAKGVARGTVDLLNPLSRAGYKEGGYSRASQDIISGHLDDAESGFGGRAVQKAVAQTQYLRNIGEQANRIGKIDPALAKLTDEMSNLKTAVPNEPGTVAALMQETPATEVVGQRRKTYGPEGKYRKDPKTGKYRTEDVTADYVVSDADAAYIDKHVNNATGNPDVITVKRPEQLNTGKHKFDVLGNRNHGYRAIESAFKSHFPKGTEVTMESLGEALNAQLNKKGAKKFTLERADDNTGWWVSNGTNASAITEGGINALIKVSPDGQLTGVMSDRHDWLEKVAGKISGAINKIPGANVDLEKAVLPTSLAAVTPPMYKNVYDTTLTKKALAKHGREAPSKRRQPNPKVAQGSDYATVNNNKPFTDPLRELANRRASDAAFGSELLSDAQKGVGLFGSAGNRVTAGGLPVGLMNPEEQEKQKALRQNLQAGNVRGENAKPFYS